MSRDFTVDPDELIAVATRTNNVRDGLFGEVWRDEVVGDGWLDHGAGPDDERLTAAMKAYVRSLRAATSRLADRAERLGDGLRASADTYIHADQTGGGLLPPPDPFDGQGG